jgi:diadenosine tetraphosphate (Ap4A) HIT family hydrolase
MDLGGQVNAGSIAVCDCHILGSKFQFTEGIMEKKRYKENCKSCLLLNPTKPEEGRKEGIIKLDKFWSLNHYNGPEGFLGWLALSPIAHRDELSDLSTEETTSLGVHIRNVELALREYWSTPSFKKDPLLKIYVIYFFESKDFHLHFHLIPRTERFSHAFSTRKPAWDTPKLTTCWSEFPEQYRIRCREKAMMWIDKVEKHEKVAELIAFLKNQLNASWLISPRKE